MTIDRTTTGWDIHIGRIYITINAPRFLLVPLFRVWII